MGEEMECLGIVPVEVEGLATVVVKVVVVLVIVAMVGSGGGKISAVLVVGVDIICWSVPFVPSELSIDWLLSAILFEFKRG